MDIDDDVYLVVNKTNSIAIKMYKSIGFIYYDEYESDDNFEWMIKEYN